MVALCCIVLPVSAFAFSKSQPDEYTASASLLFRDPGFDQKLFGSETFQRSTDPAREAATNLKLVSLGTVAQRTARRLPGVGDVRSKVKVSSEGESDVVSVSATDRDPRRAARIANVFSEEYIAFRRSADRAKIAEARRLVQRRLDAVPRPERNGSQGRSLRDRLQQLDILSSLQTGNAELAERAEAPSSPSSPKVARNTLVGGFLGVIFGVGLALLLERLDRRLRDPKELEEMFDRPILGAIPDSRELEQAGAGQIVVGLAVGEAFRMLRANLRYFNIGRDVQSVLVTSASPGDGKTTVSWNMAATAAGSGSRVLLIEADLRHPRLAAGLGLQGSLGLSTVLSGQAELEDAIHHISLGQEAGDGGARTLDVVLAGPLPPNPSDLLESDRMRDLIATSGPNYDLLVVDTPPTSVVSDAIPLVKQVGGVIVVGRLGKTTREAAQHLCNQLRNLDAPVLGVVVNGIGTEARGYGYGYGYGYGQQAEGPAAKPLAFKSTSLRARMPGRGRAEAGAKAAERPGTGEPEGAAQVDLQAEGEGRTLRDARRSAIERLEQRFPGIAVESVRFEVIEAGDAVPARVRAQVSAEAAGTATNGDLLERASRGGGGGDPNSGDAG